jgi:hypothetical protein
MIPPRRSIPVDYEVDPETINDTGRDWPRFADEDPERLSALAMGIVLAVVLVAVALVFLIILGWRVAP